MVILLYLYFLLYFADLTYPGSDNDLIITRHYTAKFTCAFELYKYPFDVQNCQIKVRLPKAYEGHVQLVPEEGHVQYLGPSTLTLYSVRNVRFGKSSAENRLSIEFNLHRRQGFTVMSTFLPSILLLLVSWATLFVRLEALNVRAIMALTTLLVLYTLFSNLSRSLPTTAAIKLIDIWFFSIIFLLFINIVIHIFVKTNGQTELRKSKTTFVQPIGLEIPEVHFTVKVMIMYRKLILPAIIIIFNIVFWIIVFYL